jgi:hypothetical protein
MLAMLNIESQICEKGIKKSPAEQQNRNSPTPKKQKLGQELNTSLAPKPRWEETSPEPSDFFALR